MLTTDLNKTPVPQGIEIRHLGQLIGTLRVKNGKIVGQGNGKMLRQILKVIRQPYDINAEEFLRALPERLKNTPLVAAPPRNPDINYQNNIGRKHGNAPENFASNIGMPQHWHFRLTASRLPRHFLYLKKKSRTTPRVEKRNSII